MACVKKALQSVSGAVCLKIEMADKRHANGLHIEFHQMVSWVWRGLFMILYKLGFVIGQCD
jgi:hypothetical protein